MLLRNHSNLLSIYKTYAQIDLKEEKHPHGFTMKMNQFQQLLVDTK